jgi:hypothetical protein
MVENAKMDALRRNLSCLVAGLVVFSLCGCGMGKAYSDTAKIFDKYGCMARDVKGQQPCQPEQP